MLCNNNDTNILKIRMCKSCRSCKCHTAQRLQRKVKSSAVPPPSGTAAAHVCVLLPYLEIIQSAVNA